MLTKIDQRSQLILDAQRKGFQVYEDDGTPSWWLVSVPARPRLPAHTQGAFKTSDRAWSVACLLAVEYPEP
jgi:hypothetical protein